MNSKLKKMKTNETYEVVVKCHYCFPEPKVGQVNQNATGLTLIGVALSGLFCFLFRKLVYNYLSYAKRKLISHQDEDILVYCYRKKTCN